MTAGVVEIVIAPPIQAKSVSITDFRKFHPLPYYRVKTPLEAEQWMADIKNLLEVAHISPVSWVNAVKIQLINVARIWGQAEEASLEKLILRDVFSKRLFTRFFLAAA